MNGMLTVSCELSNELLTTVRLATGGICSLAGLSYDDGEDCKVCVTESLLLLKHGGFARAKIEFAREDGVSVCITGEGEAPAEEVEGDEISFALLNALAQNVATHRRKGKIYQIKFCFRDEQ